MNTASGLNEIRREFLDYFAKHDHQILPSSNLVPKNDPSLLFVNSGMVQFKHFFTGQRESPFPRAATAQKCLRAGGKHNDLENVGHTARHHTFFEMLGNFSFGDYFKEQAIFLAWDLVTQGYGLPAERLLVTVHSSDDEAKALWKKIANLPDHRILEIPTDDNFWRMANTGPCGPCSEIFFDHGDSIPGGPPGSPEEDGDRFVEIWNLVFMQYNEQDNGERVPLPNPSIDTGMGLERMGAVLAGSHDNYQTDVFQALIRASAEFSDTNILRVNHRVIADHLRAVCFLMAEDVLPSNTGREYVLRRILRRAIRHSYILQDGDSVQPLLSRLVPVLVTQMGKAFPELMDKATATQEGILEEEIRFLKGLKHGLKMLGKHIGKLGNNKILPGEHAFQLFDTYGFPLDLTRDALREQGLDVDEAGFETHMAEQRRRSHTAQQDREQNTLSTQGERS